jgi:dGTPase
MTSIRRQLEDLENLHLAPQAARSAQSRGRTRPEPEDPIRPIFQRDRDRIIHSKAFRRLKHKTQVFFAPTGDHYRTRLTHTLEVSQIARSIAKVLRFHEELTEAIALGHDLGHPPFGHAGERVLDKLMPGGFNHYEQSLRVVDVLENGGQGLNLSWEVRDGIARHSKGKHGLPVGAPPEARASTLEGQIARVADIIAYVNHDIDDAVRAGVLDEASLPADATRLLGSTSSQRINVMVTDVVLRTIEAELSEVRMSEEVRVRESPGHRRVREGLRRARGHLGEVARTPRPLRGSCRHRGRRARYGRQGLRSGNDGPVCGGALRRAVRPALLERLGPPPARPCLTVARGASIC